MKRNKIFIKKVLDRNSDHQRFGAAAAAATALPIYNDDQAMPPVNGFFTPGSGRKSKYDGFLSCTQV